MIRRLRQRHKLPRSNKQYPAVQIVAPTGIAALPLDGKTTYSFAGWYPDSLKEPMADLLDHVKSFTTKAVDNLRVLIIEEVSMVENQFLERLNRLIQRILLSNAPFGGIQVILVGDFHQLPPVKPFENCIECGEVMIKKNGYICQTLRTKRYGTLFKEGDKWAFKAPVWKQLKLRSVKLEQIHLQKDTRFQDVLNKIRNGVDLEDGEWDELERWKALPQGQIAIRLMSLGDHVNTFNTRELANLNTQERSWKALDVSKKLDLDEADRTPPRCHLISAKNKEFKENVAKCHRFPTNLELKVGAKVVLLYNINQKGGLVNGSQGEVVGFANTASWPEKDEKDAYERGCADEYTALNSPWRPIVRFSNGKTRTTPYIVQSSTKNCGENRYLVARIQIPLMLAWALSIHKSQGMTLQYAEVSSRSLFEKGQLYVGVSRVTSLEGLIVTGFSRETTTTDPDVLEFYEKTPWEDLQPAALSTSTGLGNGDRKPYMSLKQEHTPSVLEGAHPKQVTYPKLSQEDVKLCESVDWDDLDIEDGQG
jgi:ATP-dependent DNA helicase PIF1